MANENNLVIVINGNAKDFLDEMDKVKKATKDVEKVLSTVAKSSAIAFAGFAGAIALATRSFAKYETALVGVGKTTDISGKKLQAFGKEFQKMASEIPLSTNELLGIAQAAGQLGVTGEANLLKFTDTIAKLGVATDLTGEQGAVALTRILNVTGEAIDSIDVFGSVVVALGNNFAATESEIVKMTTEVARSTAVFGVSSAKAAALSAALKSVGVQAQLGGSVTGRAFRAIDAAVRGGGDALKELSQVTGQTGDQLRKTFKEDSTAVFQSFIEGLGKVQRSGGDTTAALAKFGLKGDEVLKVLPVLAKNSELLGRALSLAAKETKNATALNKEAEKAYATLESQGKKLLNNFENLKVGIGAQLAPAMVSLFKATNNVVKAISELDKETLSSVATFLKWGAIITGGITAAAAFALAALKVSAIIGAISAVFVPAGIAASAFWIALTGPIGIAVAGIAAVAAGIFGLSKVLSKDEKPETLIQINAELDKLKKKQEEVSKTAKFSQVGQEKLKAIDDEIAKLEELKAAKEGAEERGRLAVKAKDETEAKKKKEETGDNSEFGKLAKEKTEIANKETQKRIEAAKKENSELKAINLARAEGETEDEKEILQRKAEIAEEFKNARLIKNAEERGLVLANLALQHEAELAEIEEFENTKDETSAERTEQRQALLAELNELDKEQKDLLAQEDLERIQESVLTENQIRKNQAEKKLTDEIKERNKFIEDETKHGFILANLNKFFASDELGVAKSTAGSLAQLSRSKNSTLKGIGKAAAGVNAAIATSEGAIKAYTSLAGIPIVGPALGIAAAGALIAFGVEQQANIASMATGGFVPPSGGGARDRFPAMLEPNELVVPAGIAQNFIQAAGVPDTQGREAVDNGGGTPRLEIVLEDRAGEFISIEQREGKALGLIGDE
jgi:TP901 family phage tail tape measure protein